MSSRRSWLAGVPVAFAATFMVPDPAARADGIAATAAVCGACHGQNGVPANPSIPVIWGQNEGYLYLQLRDFKLGNRKNPSMTAIAAGLDKPAMQQLAAYFTAKPWPNLQQPSAGPDVAGRAQTINGSAACQGCHLDHWQGDSVTPRVAGQRLQYLLQTMAQFRSGERANNPWMAALLKTYSDQDIDALAQYLAGY
jgi:cytochrome c553